MSSSVESPSKSGLINRALGGIEMVGNKLPDPAMLFLISLFAVWILSALLAPVSFSEIDPRSGEAIRINNQLTGSALATFLSNMVTIFTGFAPLGSFWWRCWEWGWRTRRVSSTPPSS